MAISRRASGRLFFFLSCLCATVFLFLILHKLAPSMENKKRESDVMQTVRERRNMDLLFVGGMPRSGTTLMRTMLDAHPDIRCGLETWVIQEILNTRKSWSGNAGIISRLSDAGVYPTALDNAIAQFIIEIIIGHGPPAKHYCNKDPYTQAHTPYLRKLFPNARFLMMIRDGRAFAHSVVTRKVEMRGYDIKSYRDVLQRWSLDIQEMYKGCLEAGETNCLPVQYEKLVLQPVATTKKIFKFLDIPWNKNVLHHEDHLNETALSDLEYSTDQVSKPLYLDGLTSWFGKLPKDVERDLPRIAPMMKLLGYDPADPKPDYGKPDEFVQKKLDAAKAKEEEKRKSHQS